MKLLKHNDIMLREIDHRYKVSIERAKNDNNGNPNYIITLYHYNFSVLSFKVVSYNINAELIDYVNQAIQRNNKIHKMALSLIE